MRSRRSLLVSVCALVLAAACCVTTSSSSAMSAASAGSKIAADLLAAIAADSDGSLRADVMVQLESPQQALENACNQSTGADRATCVADSLQQFADAAQEQVKALLAQHAGEFERSQFFWINNSVSVKKATGALVERLARLQSVVEIRLEQIFHVQGGGRA